jgi:hypothetical protein
LIFGIVQTGSVKVIPTFRINLVLKLSMAASWRLKARRLHLPHAPCPTCLNSYSQNSNFDFWNNMCRKRKSNSNFPH